jgi:nucleoside-diphosphate-sugar epimerase
MPDKKVRVVVGDDHPLFRDGLVRALSGSGEVEVVAEAEDGTSALALIKEHTPDVALLDNRMPGMDGAEVAAAVRRDELATRVLLVSAHDDAEIVYHALQQGAAGYLPKDSSRSEIVNAVRAHPCRLVHLGSAAEYGAVPPGVPVTEGAAPNPVGAYGVTKLAGTSLVLGLPDAVVLRVFNPIGPGSPSSSLLGRITGQLSLHGHAGGRLQSRTVIRVGDLGAVRDFVDVRDVADAVYAAAGAEAVGVLNVGSGRATLTRDLVRELVGLVPGAELLEEGGGSERSGGVPWQQADIGAIGAALGWRPDHRVQDTLRDLWMEAC